MRIKKPCSMLFGDSADNARLVRRSSFVAASFTAVLLAVSAAAQIPSSARSVAAIARVKPGLEKELRSKGFAWGTPIFVRIFKETDTLELWMKSADSFSLFKAYPVCTYGSGELGPKEALGDGIAPEGFYTVAAWQLNPNSQFHLGFSVGYPNVYDRANKRTGSAIMVHGECVSIGCFAMTNQGIEEIYALADAALRAGQNYFCTHIFPFRMTDEKLKKYGEVPWSCFWNELKKGYECFEASKVPPLISVKNKRHVFSRCGK